MQRTFIALGLLPGLAFAQTTPSSATDSRTSDLSPITVEAAPFAGRSPVETTQPTEVLTGEELERARAQTLGDSLQSLPGVHSAEFGSGASRPVIRGQGGPRVRVLDGGAGVVDASTISPDHNAAIEPFRAQQIEVLKGPATLLYGSGAIGGVVNIVSDMFPTEPLQGLSGAIGSSLSSVDEGRSLFGHVEGGVGGFVFHLDGLTRQTEDYDIPGTAALEDEHHEGETPEEHAAHEEESGTVANTATDTDSLAAGFSWVGPRGYVGLGVSSYDSIYGIPGHAHGEEEPADATTEEAHEDEEGVRIDLTQRRYELRAGLTREWGWLSRARGSIVVTEYKHAEIEPEEEHAADPDPAEEEAHGTVFTNDGVEARVELTHKPLAGWTGVFGFQGYTQEFAAAGEEAFVPPVDTTSTGLFWVEERAVGATGRVSLGGRIEQVDHAASGSNPDRQYELFSVSAGWHQELTPQHHLNMNISHAERAPDVLELYANGPHLATLTIENGNPDLDVERSLNFDLGHAGESGAWVFGLDLFYTRYDDYIFAEELAHADEAAEGEEAGHDEDELTPITYTQADADFWGGELHLGYRLNALHSLTAFADTVRTRRRGGDELPRIPADRVGLRFDGGLGAWSYGARLVQVFKQTRATALEGPTDGYLLLGADLSYSLPLGGTDVLLALRGRNLLNEEARNHVSFLKKQAPLPGANAQFDIEWRF